MRIVFFGSASIGFPCLEAFLSSSQDEVVAAVTQPDRPAGRKQHLTACPVKSFAQERGIPVLDPESVGDGLSELEKLNADLFVVVAYGQYIPQSILSLPVHGAINLHPSLLPKYRGSSPIQWAIANGDSETGVTILYVSRRMDAGDILLQRSMNIDPEATAETLEPLLAEEGARLLMEAVEQIRCGTASPVPQNEAEATEIRKLSREDGRIDWTQPAEVLRNRIRAFVPWPGSFCEIPTAHGPQRLKVLKTAVEEVAGTPGQVLDLSGSGPLIATGNKALRLLEVQPAGKKPMSGEAWLRGRPLASGDFLG
ncbi:MAG: methionyl-tRNA formyltransferase [Kiritimatiellales bacterium]